MGTTEKSLDPSSLHPSFRYLKTLMRFPPLNFLSKSHTPSVSLSSQKMCYNTFIILVEFCCPCVPWTGEPRLGHIMSGMSSSVLIGREWSPALTWWQYYTSCRLDWCLSLVARAHFLFMVHLVSFRSPKAFSEIWLAQTCPQARFLWFLPIFTT